MKPVTVAIVAGQLVVGGAERQLYLWLSHLDRSRFRPVVVTLHPDAGDYWEGPIESLDIPVLRVPRRRNRLARLTSVFGLLRPFRPSLVHGWHLFASPYAGLVARLLGARASLGSLRASYETYESQRLLAAVTPRLVDGLVVNSQWAGRRLADRHRGLRRKIHVVANAVEAQAAPRAQMRRRLTEGWGVPGERVWVGTAARFDPGKRLDVLLDAFAPLARGGADAHLVLMGDGREREALESKVSALGLRDRVTFTGAEPDARSLMSAFDIFCFTSMDEGFPNVVLEASAVGVPVVGWRTPFLEEAYAHDESALMVSPGNLDELTAALESLTRDSGRRLRLGERARLHVLDRFSVRRLVESLTGVYDSLLGVEAAIGSAPSS